MRPLKLKMAAFGPYITPITLNFEENLRDTKIFLINGATGAGKTTILDAICFALYGTASGDERDGVMMRSKGISDKIKTEVEFSFALGEKNYTVYRNLNCKGEKKAELTCAGEIISTKTTAVTKKIESLLGFNAKQFRQVVLLPQGEFKSFLSANSDERQPILDALFNSELYQRIESILEEKSSSARKILEDLNRDKENLTIQLQGAKADPAALEKLRQNYFLAKEKSAEFKKIAEKAQNDLTAGKILANNFAELENRNKSLETAKKNLDSAEKDFASIKIEHDLRESEQLQREKFKSESDKLTEIKKLLAALEIKRKELADAEKKLKFATDALKKFEDDAKKFDKRLAELKKRRGELFGAEKRFIEAQTLLKSANDREKVLKEISWLERELASTQKQIYSAEKLLNEADIEQKRLEKLQKDGSAARLAKNLQDGEPCPVCGSKIHYKVDFSDIIVPSDKEIAESKAKVELRKKILDGKKNSASSIEGQLISKRDELKKFFDVPTDEKVQKNYAEAKKDAKEFADCEKRIAKGEKCIEDNKIKLEEARENKIAASNDKIRLETELQTIQSQIPQNYLINAEKLDENLIEAQKKYQELENAWKIADKKFRAADKQKSSCEGIFSAAKKLQAELAEKLKEKTPPNVESLKNLAKTAQKNYDEAIRAEISLKNNLESLTSIFKQLSELNEKISAAEETFRVWKKLSDAANGKILGNKLSFARYYLGAMFEQVLTEANYRLEKMSDRRYNLQSKSTRERANSKIGLNLEIFDDYTGETRPVATLSGGESFLASLSLALGLSAVVRNNLGGIKLDTIFIDEGFGTLDSETLDFAIKTLIELQSNGRLVGIISHVEELKNQMPVRLEVFKTKTGSSAKFVR